jgi:RHS repeat-associated protein
MRSISRFLVIILSTAVLLTLLPGNVSGKPIDLGGFGESITGVVNTILDLLPDIDINVSADNPEEEQKLQGEKIVVEVDPEKDREIKSPSEKITLKIPMGAVEKKTEIEFIEYAPTASTGMVMLSQFELNAKEKDTGKAFSTFTKNLEISIKHEPEEVAGIDINSLCLYYLDEETRQWIPIGTSSYDPKEKIIKASVDHFTYYGEQANPQQVGPGRVMAAQVSLSSGTSTFSYPFELPPGPGSFKPKLELTYNSGSVDEMKNKQSVGSWVGTGWNLHLGRISCDAANGKYTLDLNGGSYELITADETNFRTQPDEYFKITRSGNTWDVFDREGNYYRFGGTTDSAQYYYDSWGVIKYYRFDLNLIRDTNNNQALITYIQDIRPTWVRSAYPEYLTYGNVQVHFTCSYDESTADGNVRYDNPITYSWYGDPYCWDCEHTNPAPKIMENRKLNSIEIKVSGNLLRKYAFSYNTTNRVFSSDYGYESGGIYYSGRLTLISITQTGADGTSQLPAMNFTYQDLQTHRHTNEPTYSGNPGNPANFSWPHLTTINSGYGGSVSFSYSQKPDPSTVEIWTREVVISKTVNNGAGGNDTRSYTYTGNPQYKGVNWDQQYRGFNEVVETDAMGNYIDHWSYTTGEVGDKDAEKLTGREYQTRWYDGFNVMQEDKTFDWALEQTWEEMANNLICEFGGYSAYGAQGVALSDDGLVYVAYARVWNGYDYSAVRVYNTAGNFIREFGAYNAYGAQGVALSDDGLVYVAYARKWNGYDYSAVRVYNTAGNFIREFGAYNAYGAQGVALSDDGLVYVAYARKWNGYDYSTVRVYDIAGNFIREFGAYNAYGAQGVALSDDCLVYVTYASVNGGYNYGAVRVYDIAGNFIREFGGYNNYGAYGITLTDNRYAHVAYASVNGGYDYSTVRVYDTVGNFIREFGAYNAYGAQGVALSGDGLVYVAYARKWNGYDYSMVREFDSYRIFNEIHLNKAEETFGAKTTSTEYVYDDYGNIIYEKIHGDISTNTDDATRWLAYYPNTTTNILSKPARERVYTTIVTSDDGGSNLKTEALYYYDGNNTSLTTPPTKGMLTRVESKKDASSSVSSYTTYDTYGNVLTTTDANGNVTTTTWDSKYHTYPATRTFPITSLTESYTYDPGTNNILNITDVNEQVTTYQYDTFKRATKVIKPGDSANSPSIEHQYNNWGTINQQHLKTLTKISEGNYVWQSQYFDGLGRVVQVHSKGESGHTIISGTTTFNNRGLVDKQYVTQDLLSSQVNGYKAPDAGWKYNTSTYDALGRVLIQTGADDTTVSNDYSIPWKVAVTNQHGFISRYYYDAFGQVVKVEEPNESNGIYATTNYTYDVLGNLTQLVDNTSNTTTMTYDWLSRKTAMTDPDMGSWSYGYDNNGNLISQTDAKSQTITMVYDTMNRLTNKNYPQGSGMTNVVYTYDSTSGGNYGKGLRTGMTDAAGSNSYKYDTRGRLIEEKRTVDSVDYTIGYTYDGLDRVATIIYPTGETVTNTYNGRAFPYSVSGSVAGNLVTSTLYNQLGAITEINLGNGVKTTYGYYGTGGTYDTTGGYYSRLWEIKSVKDSTTLQDVKHTWDAIGNLTQRQDLVGSETENFTYDFLDRITGTSGAYTQSYAYNTIGNITSMNGNSYTYGTQPHAVTQVGTTSYAYDNNGNMTTRGAQTIGWDVENRVISVTGGASFVYDGDGNRVKKIEGGETILYVNQYCEKNITTGVVTTYYYLGGQLVANRVGITLNYLHLDHLGSTSVVSDSTGAQIESIRYFPFGYNRSGSVSTEKKFTGKRLDNTGLYFYDARYYDPIIGCFTSPDTASPGLMNPQSFNKYSYCFNNPLKYNDPTGHWPNWHIIGQFFCGIGDAFVSTAKGVTQMITNPVETAKAIGYAVTHPVETIKAIASDYGEKASSVRGWGEIVGEVLITVATVEAGSFIKGSGKVAEVANLLKGEVGGLGRVEQGIGWTGKIGENALKTFGGESQVFLPTTKGGRIIDQLIAGVANESKVGRTSLTRAIASQVSMDTELLSTGIIKSSVWHFFQSPVTGKIGPTGPLAQALKNAGIKIVIH